ncbi:LOB domain-containing protein 15 [Sesamum angolense]|uniref:LOB domain-containing protein 15 n=1 Tax=Sesamum angolense TaxID=2727404 RepID=A0AAE2C3V0_9LAMI|nr:LOB domain-containing protein 15 [Sesamum angolense]
MLVVAVGCRDFSWRLRHYTIGEGFDENGKKLKTEIKGCNNVARRSAAVITLNTITPCAACKLLRRRCDEECPFSPYFSPYEPHKFAAVHKVFGASNVSKMLMEVAEAQRADAANSLVYEANVRLRDPVYGCMGAISALQHQLQALQAQLIAMKAEIRRFKYREAANTIIASSLVAELPPSPAALAAAPPPPPPTLLTPPSALVSSSSTPSVYTSPSIYGSISSDPIPAAVIGGHVPPHQEKKVIGVARPPPPRSREANHGQGGSRKDNCVAPSGSKRPRESKAVEAPHGIGKGIVSDYNVARFSSLADHTVTCFLLGESARVATLTEIVDQCFAFYDKELKQSKTTLEEMKKELARSGKIYLECIWNDFKERYEDAEEFKGVVVARANGGYDQAIRQCYSKLRESGLFVWEDFMFLDPLMSDEDVVEEGEVEVVDEPPAEGAQVYVGGVALDTLHSLYSTNFSFCS